MSEPDTELLERERASDVPEGAEMRADGSYLTPVEDLTDEQKAELLPDPDAGEDEDARLQREQAELDSPSRELGTDVSAQGGAQ